MGSGVDTFSLRKHVAHIGDARVAYYEQGESRSSSFTLPVLLLRLA